MAGMATDQPRAFGEVLRRYRVAAGLTQEELAERAGLSVRGLSDLERGARRAPYRQTIHQLADALGLTDDQHARLLAAARRVPASLPAVRSAGLLLQLTSFIGREREVAHVRHLLDTARLVTLTGAGGIGKTRLALEVARETATAFTGGATLVELAPLADPALVPVVVAAALEIEAHAERSMRQTLLDALRPRQVLLILDNCEHLVQASAELVEAVLKTCAEVTILSTSREPLGVAGETIWRVPPLAPAEAVQLFVQRASRGSPDFEDTPGDRGVITQACQQLDGIPLAIELAAARVSAMSVEQIAARLHDSLRLLTSGHRTALPRQRTLRGTFDWSYDLLTHPEQQLLKRLSVFAGGWTLAAAEAVCSGSGIASSDVLDLLVSLVDKSLVLTEQRRGGLDRYRLLETLRAYAAEKLQADAGQDLQIRTRHRDWCIELAERFEADWRSPRQKAWFEQLAREEPNLRAALRWSTDRREAEAGLRLAAALCRFWDVRGSLGEGRGWLADLLARADQSVSKRVRAKALSAAGYLAVWQVDSTAGPLLGEALDLWRELGEAQGIATTLVSLGLAASRGQDLAEATVLNEEGLRVARAIGDWADTYWALTNLAGLRKLQADDAGAQALFEESLALKLEHGDHWAAAISLMYLGEMAIVHGDHARAAALLRQSLTLQHDLGSRRGVFENLELLAETSNAQGNAHRAARLFAAAEALREAHGGRRMIGTFGPALRARLEPAAFEAVSALEPAAFKAAWAEGRSMSLDEAVAFALGNDAGLNQRPVAELAEVCGEPGAEGAGARLHRAG